MSKLTFYHALKNLTDFEVKAGKSEGKENKKRSFTSLGHMDCCSGDILGRRESSYNIGL